MRLIDADALTDRLKFKYKICNIADKCAGLQSALDQVQKVPTINAEQVVHCEDCKHCELHVDYLTGKTFNFGHCYYWKYEQGESPNSVDADDFCSHGELKV